MIMGHVSNNLINRLPRYLRLLDEMASHEVHYTSSMEIGESIGISPSLTRQDFACFGEFGIQGFGYDVLSLRENIKQVLGCDRVYGTVLVGVGNLGHAILENMGQFPTNHVFWGAFDIRPDLIGETVSGERIVDGAYLGDCVREHQVDIAILTVPRSEAQKVADVVISAGVRAIWNFTNVDLDVGDVDVLVENIHFSDSFHILSYRLSQSERE